jgi:spore germination protein YaaH
MRIFTGSSSKAPPRLDLLCALAGVAMLCASCAPEKSPPPQPPPAKQTTKIVLGYYAGYLAEAGYASVTAYPSYLSAVSADVFVVTAAGTIAGARPEQLLAFAENNDIKTYACISNFGEEDFDPALGHSAIVSNKAQVTANMVDLAREGGWAGINVDFEGLYPADRAAFSRFIADLASALHAKGLALAISVPAKSSDDVSDDWSWPFDYAALGADADLIQLMTYDEHGPWSDPGPVAGFDWMERCVQYAVSVIAPAKLLIGLPAYGYDWNLADPERNGDFAWKQVPEILARTGAAPVWDEKTRSVHIAYTNSLGTTDGAAHVAWYENPAGIAAKAALVTKYNLAGLSLWVLGDEDLSFWQAAIAGLR